MFNFNRESTFDEMIKHKVIMFNLFATSSNTKSNMFDEMQLGQVIREYLFNLEDTDFAKHRIIEAFSIKNLTKQNIIVVNNDSDTFTINQTFYDLFSYLSADKYYKLNNHSLKKFTNSMKNFASDFDKLDMNDKIATNDFIDSLMAELSEIRQELDRHIRVLEGKVNTLISLVEKGKSEAHITNHQLSKEIYEINSYFVEPLKIFLMNDSAIDVRKTGLGVTSYGRKIRDKLSKNGYTSQAMEVTAFLLNFSNSYHAKGNAMSEMLLRYVRKSVEDIRIHANIEKLYLLLEQKVNDVSHGKKANRYLRSTDLLEKINFLPELKGKEHFNAPVDYISIMEGTNIAWDNLHEELNELEGKRDKIATYFKEFSEQDEKLLKEEEFIVYGNGVLSEAKREIMAQEHDETTDIFRVCHNILKEKMENYKLFYSVLLVYSMEDELNYNIDFKTKRFIEYGGERLTYYRKHIGENSYE